ncbi:hypothetical protein niasHT_026661 [Heterodera trifolii]|uniref:Aspartyl/asparaginy/proline hydroxylase domain-containing protein n=1 Tax=Heterodera trifolii TaxID=157864 RepID=A0ABD2JT84_9BILA
MAPPSASAVGSHIGGPSPSPPLGIRAQFRRQGSSYGHSHVHHMALMVAPKRVDYSVNKGGLKTWIVLIVFVLLCSAILTIFSDENESELANEAPLADQKDGDEEDNDGGGEEAANIPSAEGITGADDGDEDEEKEEDEEEEEEEEKEEKDEQRENVKDDDADDEEERMLAKLKEAAEMARRRQKEETKLKARKEAKKRQRMEKEKEEEDRQREKTKREEEEKDEEERQREKTIREVEEKEKEEEKEEEIEKRQQEKEEEEEEEEEEQQIWERSRHGKKEKRVPSWRGTQLQAAKEDTQKPRMNLLKQRKKRIFDQRVKSNDQEEEREEGEEEEDDGEEQDEAEEEEAVVVVGELITTRKRPIYNRKALTNRYDYKHRSLLDVADFLLEKHEFDAALKHYEQILATNEHSPRALFGRGRLHQLKAEFGAEHDDDSEKFIKMALSDYNSVLENEDTPDELFKMTVHYFVECARQMGGYHHKILQAQRALVDRFPDDADIKCDFGATWLGMARPEKAADIFRNVLDNEPGHALALAYLGYIQKVYEDELERGVHALRRAMRTGDERVTGDARPGQALEVYGEAVKHGVFPSVHQRSVHNLLGLSARPWWTVEQSECAKQLKTMERQWTAIREEALKVWSKRKSLFVEEALPIGSREMMGGGELALVLRSNAIGGFREEICDRLMQSTCELLKQFETASCAKDKIKLSVLLAGTRTWPFCGPTNYVLEAQLGLVAHSDARIRVGNETRGWRPGRFLVFDTSFEREISFEGAPSNAIRLALTMELWHPQMPMELRGKIRAADGSDEEKND